MEGLVSWLKWLTFAALQNRNGISCSLLVWWQPNESYNTGGEKKSLKARIDVVFVGTMRCASKMQWMTWIPRQDMWPWQKGKCTGIASVGSHRAKRIDLTFQSIVMFGMREADVCWVTHSVSQYSVPYYVCEWYVTGIMPGSVVRSEQRGTGSCMSPMAVIRRQPSPYSVEMYMYVNGHTSQLESRLVTCFPSFVHIHIQPNLP